MWVEAHRQAVDSKFSRVPLPLAEEIGKERVEALEEMDHRHEEATVQDNTANEEAGNAIDSRCSQPERHAGHTTPRDIHLGELRSDCDFIVSSDAPQ